MARDATARHDSDEAITLSKKAIAEKHASISRCAIPSAANHSQSSMMQEKLSKYLFRLDGHHEKDFGNATRFLASYLASPYATRKKTEHRSS